MAWSLAVRRMTLNSLTISSGSKGSGIHDPLGNHIQWFTDYCSPHLIMVTATHGVNSSLRFQVQATIQQYVLCCTSYQVASDSVLSTLSSPEYLSSTYAFSISLNIYLPHRNEITSTFTVLKYIRSGNP